MAQESADDCYFYYYSSCTKGKECPFRHCEAALGTETVCVLWREGKCFRANCKFRHMENRIKRGLIPCFWENQPGGCRKPHCVFLHQKSKYKIVNVPAEKKRLILPESISTNTVAPSTEISETFTPSYSPNADTNEISLNCSDGTNDLSSQPVVPFVVSFDEGEESDTESVSSTPMKSGPLDSKFINSSSARKNLSSCFSDMSEKDDFGIKTLEQIRMEKIHKESEHFYKSDDTSGKSYGTKTLEISRTPTLHSSSIINYSAYDAPVLNSKTKVSQSEGIYKTECYPPKSDYISISSNEPIEKSKLAPKNESTIHSFEQESDLRGRLLKKREFPSYSEKVYDSPKLSAITKVSQTDGLYKTECYPPDSDYISISTNESVEKSKLLPKSESTALSFEQESDLRGRLLKKREFPSYSETESPPSKRVISFKKQEKKIEGPLDFKIKTLDEIRKERGEQVNKVKNPFKDPVVHKKVKIVHSEAVESSDESKSPNLNDMQKISGKPKIKRLSTESYSKIADAKDDSLDELTVKTKDTRPQMILHEVQNIEDEQNKTNQIHVSKKAISAFNGKRKSDNNMAGKNKALKMDSVDMKNNAVTLDTSNEFQNGDNLKMKTQVNFSKEVAALPDNSTDSLHIHGSLETSEDSKNELDLSTQSSNNKFTNLSESKIDLEKSLTDKNEIDKNTSRSISVDELDNFLNDTDVNLGDEDDSSDKGAEDIFKEIEQLLES